MHFGQAFALRLHSRLPPCDIVHICLHVHCGAAHNLTFLQRPLRFAETHLHLGVGGTCLPALLLWTLLPHHPPHTVRALHETCKHLVWRCLNSVAVNLPSCIVYYSQVACLACLRCHFCAGMWLNACDMQCTDNTCPSLPRHVSSSISPSS